MNNIRICSVLSPCKFNIPFRSKVALLSKILIRFLMILPVQGATAAANKHTSFPISLYLQDLTLKFTKRGIEDSILCASVRFVFYDKVC